MTYLEIYNRILEQVRLETEDVEPNIESQIKNNVNVAYKIVAGRTKQIVTDYIPIIQGIVELPKNVQGVIEFDPPIDPKYDRLIGDNINTRRADGEIFTIKYAKTPEPLVNDADEPQVPERLLECLVDYPLYRYFASKKRLDLAGFYKNSFDEKMQDNERLDNENQTVLMNVYSDFFN